VREVEVDVTNCHVLVHDFPLQVYMRMHQLYNCKLSPAIDLELGRYTVRHSNKIHLYCLEPNCQEQSMSHLNLALSAGRFPSF
jgi:hypothetical protein